MNTTKIFLNTWGAYNNGSIGFGWFGPHEAIDFIEESLENDDFVEKYGEEFFIADIDNYLGVDFGTLEYADIYSVCETIETLEDMDDFDRDCVIALMEINACMYNEISEAINDLINYTFYSDIDQYYDFCDEIIECKLDESSDILSRYFDYEAYHRDCDYDVSEASNGIVIFN